MPSVMKLATGAGNNRTPTFFPVHQDITIDDVVRLVDGFAGAMEPL